MTDRILRQAVAAVDDSLVLYKHAGTGHLCIRQGEKHVCDNSRDQKAWAADVLLAIRQRELTSGKVAMLGGGFCILAKLLGPDYDITVYEIDPDLAELCPTYATFIVGDWHEKFSGKWDVIAYDIAEPLSVLEERRLSEAGWLLR